MALTGNYNFKGLDIPNAYIRVESANYFSSFLDRDWETLYY